MAIGHSSGAFATTDKSPNYMSGALSANADLKYKYDVLNQDKEEKVKARKQSEIDKVEMPKLENIATLNDNLEKTKAKLVLDTQQAWIEAKKTVSTTDDPIKKADAVAKLNNLKNNFDLVNSFSTQINDKTKYITEQTGVKYDEQSAKNAVTLGLMAGKGYGNMKVDPTTGQLTYDVTDENGNVIEGNHTFASLLTAMDKNLYHKSTLNDELKKNVDSVGKITKVDDKGIQTIETVAVKPEDKEINRNAFIKDVLGDDSNRNIYARDNNIDPNDNKAIVDSLTKLYDSKFDETHKNTINTSLLSRNLAEREFAYRKKKDAKDDLKDEQSFTTTPEIPLAFKNAGVSQGKDLTMVVENGKAKPSLSFTDKNTGKVINLQNVIPQKVSRVKEGDRYVYVTEVSHLKPTKVYADGGEKKDDGTIAKKGDLLGTTDIQTSEVVRLKEANALNLLKSKTIKTKEDLRNIFPKENVQQDVENNSIPTYNISDLKNNGWNDSQIKQAVREGKIKTK